MEENAQYQISDHTISVGSTPFPVQILETSNNFRQRYRPNRDYFGRQLNLQIASKREPDWDCWEEIWQPQSKFLEEAKGANFPFRAFFQPQRYSEWLENDRENDEMQLLPLTACHTTLSPLDHNQTEIMIF